MQKESFVFRKEWKEAIIKLPDNIRLEVYEAIIDYGTSGKINKMSPTAELAFKFIKKTLEKDNERYEEIKRKRSEAGKKGGAKVGNKNASKTSKNKQNKHLLESGKKNDEKNKQNEQNKHLLESPEQADIKGRNDGLDEREKQAKQAKQTVYVYDNNISSIKDSSSNEEQSSPEDNIIVKYNLEANASLSSSTYDAANFQALQSYFNSILVKNGSTIKQISKITDNRKGYIRARIREHGKKAVAVVFEKAAKSDFLNGKNNSGFVASFDWMMRPNNFIKILEGNYDNRTDNGDYESQQRQASVAEAIMRRLAEDDAKGAQR